MQSMGALVRFGASELTLMDAAVFAAGRQAQVRRSARRAMPLQDLRSLIVEPESAAGRMRFRAEPAEREGFLECLAEAIGTDVLPLEDLAIPEWADGEFVTLSRIGDLITGLRIIEAKSGDLRIADSHFAEPNGSAARSADRALRSVPGVLSTAGRSDWLKVLVDSARISEAGLVRVVESQFQYLGIGERCRILNRSRSRLPTPRSASAWWASGCCRSQRRRRREF